MVLIQPENPLKLLDIDNYVCIQTNEEGRRRKKVIGFIYELVGPVTFPLYSIQMYPGFAALIQTQAKRILETKDEKLPKSEVELYKHMLHRMDTFVLKRTLKVIENTLDELISKPGCDASNMFDEEVIHEE